MVSLMTTLATEIFGNRSDNKRGISSPPTHRGKGSIPGAGPLASIVKVPRLEKEKNESVIQFKGMSLEKAKACEAGLALLELYHQQLAQQGSAQAGVPEKPRTLEGSPRSVERLNPLVVPSVPGAEERPRRTQPPVLG